MTSSTSTGIAPGRISAKCRTVGVAGPASPRVRAAMAAAMVSLREPVPIAECWHDAQVKERPRTLLWLFFESRALSNLRSVFDRLGRYDLDVDASETHVGSLAGSQQPDRGNPQILEDLRTEPDFPPLLRTCDIGTGVAFVRNFCDRHARRAVAQEHDHSPAGCFEAFKRSVDRLCTAKHIANDVGPMQARQHALAISDIAVDKGHVMHAVEGRYIGIALERSDFRSDMKFADPLHQLVAALSIGNQLGDRDLHQPVFFRKGGDSWTAHHRAIVVHQLSQHADRRQRCEPAKVDAGFGVSGAHQHAALARDKRKYVAGTYEIRSAAVVVGKGAHRVATLFG